MVRLRVVVAVVLAAILIGAPAQAAPTQLYYTVTASYQGARENLWEIAARFLGDADRAGEILDLNSGRVQPDGDRLSDPSHLNAGWNLILPWDAAGTELHQGQLPAGGSASSGCQLPSTPGWGLTLLNPNRAWPVADGAGVKVGVVGSGVDGSTRELAGRVATGADVAGGTGRGDTGCDGGGTALAGLVAAVAPGARFVPVKIGKDARLVATGIDVAAASGARVVLVGTEVDAGNAEVRAAVSDAISRDVVVVLPARAAAEGTDGLLRVGSINENRQPADNYPADAVDLLAPGVGDRASAAAFVAGTVALVRAAHPELHAAEVTRQVLTTVTDDVVSPVAAVTGPLPAGVGVNAAVTTPANGLGTLSRVLWWIAVGLAVLLLLPFLIQRPTRMLRGLMARRRAERQAKQTRARMADDNYQDPFWEPPRSGPVRDEAGRR